MSTLVFRIGKRIGFAAALITTTAIVSPPARADVLFSPQEQAGARVPTKAAVMPGFTDVVQAVKPAVVSVRVKAREPGQPSEGPNPFEGTPFERFFRNRPEGQQAPTRTIQAQGSGFFVSPDGYIVTNNHVVEHAVSLDVVTDDGKIYQAKVIGTDPATDLALIKVDGQTNLPYLKLGTDKPRIGEWVLAMGNPFGLGGTVTAGIVSAEGRDIGAGPYDDFIQIDAPVNRGNSGGPTFNLKGEVIGVNTAIFSPSGGSVGIAFDIPAATVAAVIPKLQQGGTVVRGWLGVHIQSLTPEIADSIGLKSTNGVLVSEPQAGGPAAKAGLEAGDVITAVNDQQIKDARDLARRIADLGPDKQVSISIIRGGKRQSVSLTLGRLAGSKREANSSNGSNDGGQVEHLGLTVAPAASIEGAGAKGVAIVEVDPNGRAADVGLRPGDVIVSIAGKPVARPQDITTAIADARTSGRKNALVQIRRANADEFVALPVPPA